MTPETEKLIEEMQQEINAPRCFECGEKLTEDFGQKCKICGYPRSPVDQALSVLDVILKNHAIVPRAATTEMCEAGKAGLRKWGVIGMRTDNNKLPHLADSSIPVFALALGEAAWGPMLSASPIKLEEGE